MYLNYSLHDFTGKDLPKCRRFHARWPRIRYFRNFLFRSSAAKKSEWRLKMEPGEKLEKKKVFTNDD